MFGKDSEQKIMCTGPGMHVAATGVVLTQHVRIAQRVLLLSVHCHAAAEMTHRLLR